MLFNVWQKYYLQQESFPKLNLFKIITYMSWTMYFGMKLKGQTKLIKLKKYVKQNRHNFEAAQTPPNGPLLLRLTTIEEALSW